MGVATYYTELLVLILGELLFYHRPWKMAEECMGRSVTGGRWVSASMKCCLGRRHSMQSHCYKLTVKLCSTRYVYILGRVIVIAVIIAFVLVIVTAKGGIVVSHGFANLSRNGNQTPSN